jgi:hypothetical protein
LAAISPVAILADQDAVSSSVGFAVFAFSSASLKCSIAAVRLLRRWWNRMSLGWMPARRHYTVGERRIRLALIRPTNCLFREVLNKPRSQDRGAIASVL